MMALKHHGHGASSRVPWTRNFAQAAIPARAEGCEKYEAPPAFSWLAGLCVVEAPWRGSQHSPHGSLGEHGRILRWPDTTIGPIGLSEKSILSGSSAVASYCFGTSCELLQLKAPAFLLENREPSLDPNCQALRSLDPRGAQATCSSCQPSAPRATVPDRQSQASLLMPAILRPQRLPRLRSEPDALLRSGDIRR